jgi:pseudouridine kinase
LKILLIGNVIIEKHLDSSDEKVGGIIFYVTKKLANLLPKGFIKLIYPLANDNYGKIIKQEIEKLGVSNIAINVEQSLTTVDVNIDNELKANLEKKFNIQKLAEFENDVKDFDVIVSDLNFIEPLKYLLNKNPQAKAFIDATSKEDVNKLETLINDNIVVKFNREQVSHFTLRTLFDTNDCFEIRDILSKRRINQAFITLDKDGCYFFEKNHHGITKAEVITDKKYYYAGAAFLAGVVHAYTLSADIEFMAKHGIEESAKQINREIEANFLKSLNSDK